MRSTANTQNMNFNTLHHHFHTYTQVRFSIAIPKDVLINVPNDKIQAAQSRRIEPLYFSYLGRKENFMICAVIFSIRSHRLYT